MPIVISDTVSPTVTAADLVAQALRKLNVIRAGQTPPADVAVETKTELYNFLLAFEREHGLDFDPTGSTFPREHAATLVLIIANRIGPNYGRSFDIAFGRALEAQLRSGMVESDHVEPTVEDF